MTGATVLADDVDQLARALGFRRNRLAFGRRGERGDQRRTNKNCHMGKQRRNFHHAFQGRDSAAEHGGKPAAIP
jgi:hypothetical protein